MRLSELKEPYERIDKSKLDGYNCNKVVELYLSSSSTMTKNLCVAFLVCESWNLVQKIYRMNSNIMTEEECYDVFIQTLFYVIKSHPWTKQTSSLYNDKNAFKKAMAITVQSRRKNYLKAKFTQKRVANVANLSLDSLEEDFQDGYFLNYEDDYFDNSNKIGSIVKSLFEKKEYVSAFVLEGVIYNNVFNDESNFDIRKLRKYLRNIDETFCEYFADKYILNINEVKHSLSYFMNISREKLDTKIDNAFTILRTDNTIRQILNK